MKSYIVISLLFAQAFGEKRMFYSTIFFFRSPGSLRLTIAMGWRLSSSVVRRALTSSSQELLGQSLPHLVCRIYRVRKLETGNFMTAQTD